MQVTCVWVSAVLFSHVGGVQRKTEQFTNGSERDATRPTQLHDVNFLSFAAVLGLESTVVDKETTSKAPVPVNIIAGPLGAGKTTALNSLLGQRPKEERWAVLVNEYGLVGIDAALLQSGGIDGTSTGGDTLIREVAGGCICCTAGLMFEISLVLLLQRRPDRLLIEPTGLATLSGILETLARPGIAEAVDLRSVVCLLDPARLTEDLKRDEVVDQVEFADVVVGSRADLATEDELQAFHAWGQTAKRNFVGTIENGRLSVELLDATRRTHLSAPLASIAAPSHHLHVHQQSNGHNADDKSAMPCPKWPIVRRDHFSKGGSTVGWLCWDGITFDAEKMLAWLTAVASRTHTQRAKAVVQTSRGWIAFNHAHGAVQIENASSQRQSRLEFIVDGAAQPNVETLEAELKDCIVTAPV